MGESSRRQLPPQIKRVELASRSGGRPVIRYQLTVDVGVVDGKRKHCGSGIPPRRRRATHSTRSAAKSPAIRTCTDENHCGAEQPAVHSRTDLRDTSNYHRKTLNDPESAGRVQSNPDPNDRVKILDEEDRLLHSPPPVEELPDRTQRLCDFANAVTDSPPYVPLVVRALTIHFMTGYDHYGNGLNARALLYSSMLKQGYWLTEHLAISLILKDAPAQYARSFILTEQDEGDLTYLFLYHLDVIRRALEALDKYLHRETAELQRARSLLVGGPSGLNHRQVALLQAATRDPSNYYTAESHEQPRCFKADGAERPLRLRGGDFFSGRRSESNSRGCLDQTCSRRSRMWLQARRALARPRTFARVVGIRDNFPLFEHVRPPRKGA